jgi:tetratricopeptide (TPR) repeat protein
MMKRMPLFFVALMLLTGVCLCDAASAPKQRDLYNEALLALKAGDTLAAVDFLTRALNAEPSDYRCYNDRGVAYKRMGDLDKAIADYSRALEIKPDYTNALNNRGVAYTQQGQYEKAVQDFTEALKFGEMKGRLHTNLGTALCKAGEHAKAITEFDAAASYQPLDPGTIFLLAESLEKVGNHERALRTYRSVLGRTTDPAAIRDLERKISRLEKMVPSANASALPTSAPNAPAAKTVSVHSETAQTREILPAPSRKNAGQPQAPAGPQPQASSTSVASGRESPKGLYQQSRARSLEKFSPASAEIFRQGLQFVEQSDPRKALIRFEDSLQLEKRNKNPLGAGWSLLEIGRVHSKLGDHAKAANAFDEALKIFSRVKAGDETIVALLEAASNWKTLGQADKAQSFYAKAADEANARGLQNLARFIGDMAAGKIPAEPVKVAAVKPQRTEGDTQTSANPTGADRQKVSQPATQPNRQPAPTQTAAPAERTAHIELKKAAPQSIQTTPGKDPTPSSVQQMDVKPMPGPALTTSNSQRLADLGKGPAIWGTSGKTLKLLGSTPQTQEKASHLSGTAAEAKSNNDRPAAAETNMPQSAEKPAPRIVASASSKQATDLSADLAELRKCRDANNELGMMSVLERLADKYSRQKEYGKALHAISASLAFGEKLLAPKDLDAAFERSGAIKDHLGDRAGALEDMSRALSLQRAKQGPTASANQLDLRARRLASGLGVDYVALLNAFQRLWKARAAGDDQEETEALYLVGRLYDKADKPAQALNYYERSSASMLVDKARIYEKLGKADLAQQSYDQALEIFKKLDYSRYLEMKKKRKNLKALSLQ